MSRTCSDCVLKTALILFPTYTVYYLVLLHSRYAQKNRFEMANNIVEAATGCYFSGIINTRRASPTLSKHGSERADDAVVDDGGGTADE